MSEESQLENPNPSPKSTAPPSLSLSIWPPSGRTRESVTRRLVESLSSTSSILAKRYGVISPDAAEEFAAEIEKEAFAAAEVAAADEAKSASIDGGLEILEIYSKEISSRMIQLVKARNPSPRTELEVPPSVASLLIADKGENAESEATTATA